MKTNIQDYVLQGGRSVTAGEIGAFRQKIAAYKLKAETLDPAAQPALRAQAQFLIRYIEDVLDGAHEPEELSTVPEAIFAVRYLAKGVDIIPDLLPGGFTDDAAVLRAVLDAHAPEFHAYAAKIGEDFGALLA